MRITATLTIAIAIGAAVFTGRPNAASPDDSRVPVLVELFTSEGCSSCPPADRVLTDLIATQPVAGALVIGLSEHVDYWDRLGWKDAFSDARFTERQHAYAYATRSGGRSIYTPQMIVDGDAEFVGSDRPAALAAIRKAASQPKRAVRLSWAAPDRVDIDVAPGNERQASRVFLAVIEHGLSTPVKRGENGGRTLTHDGVVRRLVELGQTDVAGAYHASVPVTLEPVWRRDSTRLVVWTQRPGAPVTAAGQINAQ